VIVRDELVVQPGETKAINRLLSPETQAAGVMAAFREVERARWRGLVSVVPGKDNTVTINLDDVAVRVSQSAR